MLGNLVAGRVTWGIKSAAACRSGGPNMAGPDLYFEPRRKLFGLAGGWAGWGSGWRFIPPSSAMVGINYSSDLLREGKSIYPSADPFTPGAGSIAYEVITVGPAWRVGTIYTNRAFPTCPIIMCFENYERATTVAIAWAFTMSQHAGGNAAGTFTSGVDAGGLLLQGKQTTAV